MAGIVTLSHFRRGSKDFTLICLSLNLFKTLSKHLSELISSLETLEIKGKKLNFRPFEGTLLYLRKRFNFFEAPEF